MSAVRTLQRDPRFVASLAALLWMLFDDTAGDPYRTFLDPGAACMQSIVFAQFLALAVLRRWDWTSSRWFVGAVVFKLMFQGIFYVTRALPLDLATLAVALLIVAVLSAKVSGLAQLILRCVAALAGFLLALAFCVGAYQLSGRVSTSNMDREYWFIAVARVAVAVCFWSALEFSPGNLHFYEEHGPASPWPHLGSIIRSSFNQLGLLLRRFCMSGMVILIITLGLWLRHTDHNHYKELYGILAQVNIRTPLSDYALANQGRYPNTLADLPTNLPSNLRQFHDPFSGKAADWIYLGGYAFNERSSKTGNPLILLVCPSTMRGGQRWVVYTDSSAGGLRDDELLPLLTDQLQHEPPPHQRRPQLHQ